MTKGRQKINRTDGALLPTDPPSELSTKPEQAAYRRLREDLSRSGFSQKCDMQAVLLCCRRIARAERIAAEIAELPSLMMMDKLHPLLSELRNTETGILAGLGALNLTPRARSSSRAKSADMNQKVESADPEKQKILDLIP